MIEPSLGRALVTQAGRPLGSLMRRITAGIPAVALPTVALAAYEKRESTQAALHQSEAVDHGSPRDVAGKLSLQPGS